jgi:LPS export ABC transporter protein LptC
MINKRNAIILGLLLALVGIEIVVVAPKDASPNDESVPVTATEPGAGQVMQDVHLVEAKPEGKEWELWAKRALRATDESTWTIENVSVKFFAANGVFYTVTGKRGKVTPNKNDIRIAGNVVTRSSNGYEFRTESAFYDSKNKRLLSPEKVAMTGPKDENGGALDLTGADMLVDVPTSDMRIGRDVHAKRKIKGDRLATIASRRAFFSGKSNQARFAGDVVIDVETLRITGPEARFHYRPGSDFIESMSVDGGARVTDIDKMATSDQVNVYFDSEKIVFLGSPKLVQNGDELSGEEIVFLNGGRKVQVNNAHAKVDESRGTR